MRLITAAARRFLPVLGAVALTTGLLVTLAPGESALASGGPAGGFVIPAGVTTRLTGGSLGGYNELSWGYKLDGVDQTVATKPYYDPPTTESPVTIPASGSDRTFLLFLTDETCSHTTYYSDGSPVDHATVAGTGPSRFSIDIADAGGYCEAQTSERFGSNFHMDMQMDALTMDKSGDYGSVGPGANNGYTITVNNPNPEPVPVTSLVGHLPAGFAYHNGSTTGDTTGDPSIGAEDGSLTWDNPFTVPGSGSASLHFDVTVPNASDVTYYNSADAVATGFVVTGTGDAAPVYVNGTGGGCEAVPPGPPTNVLAYAGDASAAVSWTPPEGDGGDPISSYTVYVTNNGGGAAPTHASAPRPRAVQVAGTRANITGLINGDPYQFTVAATNCAGTGSESEYSNEVTPTAGSSAQVIDDGNLTQSTGTTKTPTPGDPTIGMQTFPAGTTGIGTLEELSPDGPYAARNPVPIAQFCGGGLCIGNTLQAKLHDGSLGPNPRGGVSFYRLILLQDRSLVRHLGTHVQVWYDGNLDDDSTVPSDPTPPYMLSPCSGRFNGTPCVLKIIRTRTRDLRAVVRTGDIDPRMSTSR